MWSCKWDGREKTADRILDMLPSGTVSWSGGAPGIPRELYFHPNGRKSEIVVPKGKRVGVRDNGNAFVK